MWPLSSVLRLGSSANRSIAPFLSRIVRSWMNDACRIASGPMQLRQADRMCRRLFRVSSRSPLCPARISLERLQERWPRVAPAAQHHQQARPTAVDALKVLNAADVEEVVRAA